MFQFTDMMNKLTQLTGKKIEKPLDLYYLYHTFVSESFMNLTLPRWANNYFPDPLIDGIVAAYDIANSTPLLKKLYAGKSHIQRFIIIMSIFFYSALLICYRPNNSYHIGEHGHAAKCELIGHENLFI